MLGQLRFSSTRTSRLPSCAKVVMVRMAVLTSCGEPVMEMMKGFFCTGVERVVMAER